MRIARVLCVAAALTGWAPITHAQTVYIPKPGDLNADQQVDAADLGVMLRWIADPGQCTARQFRLADLDGSGELDERDLTALALRISTRTSLQDCVLVAPCCRFIWPHGCCSIATERCIEIGGQPGDPEQGGIDDTGPPGGGGSGGGSDGGAATIGGPGPNPGGGSGGGNNNDPCAFMLAVAGADDELVELGRIVGAGGALRTIGSITLHAVDRDERPVNVTWRIRGPSDEEFSQSSSASTFAVGGPPGLYTVRVHKQDCGAHDVQVHIYDFKVKSVTFGGGNHLIYPDNPSDPEPFNQPYTSHHWLDANGDGDTDDPITDPNPQNYTVERRLPVAYTRNRPVTIESVEFHIDPGEGHDPPDAFAIHAIHEERDHIYLGLNDTALESSEPLPNQIDFIADYTIAWRISFDGQHVWRAVGQTSHDVYVTLNDPDPTTWMAESIIHIGCKSAIGAHTAFTAAMGIFSDFADNDVRTAKGTQLCYYRDGEHDNTTVIWPADLIRSPFNGQCLAWAGLLTNTLWLHGLNPRIIEARADPTTLPPACVQDFPVWLLIKNYIFTGSGSSGCPGWWYRANIPAITNAAWSTTPECIAQPGLPGQGSPEPPSAFYRHFLVAIDVAPALTLYFDPSYGHGPFAGKDDWQFSSVAGFAREILTPAHQDFPVGACPSLGQVNIIFTE